MRTNDSLTEQQAAGGGGAEPLKPLRQIVEQEMSEGLSEIKRSTPSLFLAGLSAGLDVGFSLLFIAVTMTLVEGQLSDLVIEILIANAYAIGFIFVVMGRSALFTEYTALATLPVLTGRASLSSLARLWGVVYLANLVGGAIFAALAALLGPALGVVDPAIFGEIARGVVGHPWQIILLSGVLAGWLMGLLAWLVAAGRDTISQVVFVWLVAASIGFGHFHHSIVGTIEVLAGIFSAQGITLVDFGHFLLWATVGNAVGGVVFVALIAYRLNRSERATTPG
ncbi:MAG: formate/nitrite transporter family protein [Chloroflexota bacterium]|nr:formate/nitrite transporter family protein [Chloroflexota bacterium]